MIVDPIYIDDGALRQQDRAPLEVFLADHDRTQITGRGQPFFSGREKEVGVFRQAVNALSLGRQGNATIAVEGPPGAGKSALMSQFMEEMESLPPTEVGERRWLPVVLDGSVAMSPQELMAEINGAIAETLAKDLIEVEGGGPPTESAGLLARLFEKESIGNAKGFAKEILDRGGAAFWFSLGPKLDKPPRTIQAAYRACAEDWNRWQIVLLFDEAQDISKDAPGASPGTLKSIHQGISKAPISFCAFGLPGTFTALRRVGVSRKSGGYTLRLSALEAREAEMAVNRCFAQYGVKNGEAWKRAVLDRADGWPQHLNTYMDAACTILKRRAVAENDLGDAGNSSLTEAIAWGDAARAKRYQERVDSLNDSGRRFERHARALVPVFEKAEGRPLKDDVEGFLRDELGLGEDGADAFLWAAEGCGFLSPDADPLRYAMPIPSLAGHLMGRDLPPVSEPEPPTAGKTTDYGSPDAP